MSNSSLSLAVALFRDANVFVCVYARLSVTCVGVVSMTNDDASKALVKVTESRRPAPLRHSTIAHLNSRSFFSSPPAFVLIILI